MSLVVGIHVSPGFRRAVREGANSHDSCTRLQARRLGFLNRDIGVPTVPGIQLLVCAHHVVVVTVGDVEELLVRKTINDVRNRLNSGRFGARDGGQGAAKGLEPVGERIDG